VWASHGLRFIALLCSSQFFGFIVLSLTLENICMLPAHSLAELPEVLSPGRILCGCCHRSGECVFRCLQIASCLIPLFQLLIGRRSVPERDCPLQAIRLHGACRQQRDLTVESVQRLFWLMGDGQQGNAVFIIGHDPRQSFTRRAAFGGIELCLTGRDRFCVPCLQQLGAILCLADLGARQNSEPHEYACEKWQPQSPRIE
jgi:hypothetical protein